MTHGGRGVNIIGFWFCRINQRLRVDLVFYVILIVPSSTKNHSSLRVLWYRNWKNKAVNIQLEFLRNESHKSIRHIVAHQRYAGSGATIQIGRCKRYCAVPSNRTIIETPWIFPASGNLEKMPMAPVNRKNGLMVYAKARPAHYLRSVWAKEW